VTDGGLHRSMGVASPCVDVCDMDGETGYCKGCFRTIYEIAEWGRLDDGGKQEILKRIARRRAKGPGGR